MALHFNTEVHGGPLGPNILFFESPVTTREDFSPSVL